MIDKIIQKAQNNGQKEHNIDHNNHEMCANIDCDKQIQPIYII